MENNNIVYWSDINNDLKKAKTKAKIRGAFNKVKDSAISGIKWCEQHPELAIAGTGLITMAVKQTNKLVDRHDKRVANRQYYDRSLQQNISLKRNLSKAEKTYARERHVNTGESYYEIYKSMNVLK